MINIVQVFNTIKSLANEDQSGFVTPSSFNDLAMVAQTNVYNEIMGNFDDSKKFDRSFLSSERGTSNKNKSKTRQAFFLNYREIETDEDGKIRIPSDFSAIHSIVVSSDDPLEQESVQIMYDDPYPMHRSSRPYSLTTSSGDAPVNAFFDSSNTLVFKKAGKLLSSTELDFRYYRSPGSFFKGVQNVLPPVVVYDFAVPGVYNIDSVESRNFDLPQVYFSELVNEMAKLIGVQIEESMIYQYGQVEESQPEQKTFD